MLITVCILLLKILLLLLTKGEQHMFKIEKPEMINKTFRLPAELVERLQTVAQNQGVSLNNLVKQCCEYALNNLETDEK